MKVTFTISSLRAGGAERALLTLANHWAEQGHEVSVVTFAPPGLESFYPVHPTIRLVHLGLEVPSRGPLDAAIKSLQRVSALRGAYSALKPERIVSFLTQTNVVAILAGRKVGLPVIVSERTDPYIHSSGQFWDRARDFVYPKASCLVAQSEHVKAWSRERFPRLPAEVIYNPVALPKQFYDPATSEKTIVGIGRLDEVKGFELLVAAFGRVKDEFPGWKLLIAGEGPHRKALESQIAQLGVSDRVSLPGLRRDAPELLARSSVFALTSRYEGFPNALCEAMATGLACVVSNCQGATRDIAAQEGNALVYPVDDVDALTVQLRRLLSDGELRVRLGANARRIVDTCGIVQVAGKWEGLLGSL